MPAEDAYRAAVTLLRFRHPAVEATLAAWYATALSEAPVGRWLRDLPRGVGREGIPSQPELNRWAHDATRGLLSRFPAELGPPDRPTVLLLASALCSREQWDVPFEVVGSERLGAHDWPALRTALHRPDATRAIVHTAAAGRVGTSIDMSSNRLFVVSTIAERIVTPAAVLAAANEVARLACHLPSSAVVPSLFDLPLDGHAWSITERAVETSTPNGREESAEVVIPAWTVPEHSVDLQRDPEFGFRLVADALAALLPPTPDGYRVAAGQTATATFDRYGFEAAAITLMSVELGMSRPKRRPGLRRHATVRFSRPFAVVAVVLAPDTQWNGVPVFSGWIARPAEAEAQRPAGDPV
jgi:hypothetical protein